MISHIRNNISPPRTLCGAASRTDDWSVELYRKATAKQQSAETCHACVGVYYAVFPNQPRRLPVQGRIPYIRPSWTKRQSKRP